MQPFQRLHQKTRRSHSLSPKDLQLSLLQYATLCSDQLQVYSYMEDNKIGVANVDFWLAKARYYEAERDYAKVLQTLGHGKRQLKGEVVGVGMGMVREYETGLENRLEFLIRSYTRGRRSVKDYETLSGPVGSVSTLEEPIQSCRHRTIGSTTVFIDRDCRNVYKLENLVEMYNRKCSFDRQFEMNRVRRDRAMKPLSWISERRRKLSELGGMLGVTGSAVGLAEDVVGKEEEEVRLNGKDQNLQEEEGNNSGRGRMVVETPNVKVRQLKDIDSAELLQVARRKSLLGTNRQKSPRFSCIAQLLTSAQKPHPSTSPTQQKIQCFRSQFPQPAALLPQLFSFRADSKYSKDLTFNKNQMARIQDSCVQQSQLQHRDDLLLHDVLREVQLERYQTTSLQSLQSLLLLQPIDSQKQNRLQQQIQMPRIQRRQSRSVLSELKIEQCTDPEILNRILNKQIEAISEDSMINLQALLEMEPDSVRNNQGTVMDCFGFQRPMEKGWMLMSEQRQRESKLSTITEEAPASEMKYYHK